jgi:Uma2 family endonuclease
MSSISQTQPALLSQPVLASPPLHRFTVDEYDRIVAAGALESARIELLDGIMVDKLPKSPEHTWTTIETFGMLDSRLPHGWTPRKEEPVRIPAYDEPEPDIAIVRGSNADYRHRIPTAADTALVVEVSESSLSADRGKKLAVFATAGIPVY